MPLRTGFIDNIGHPRLHIHVSGTNPGVIAELDALIDTGFTGFLMLPLAQAFPLGLILVGTGDYTLADGSLVTNFLARGTVKIPAPRLPGAAGAASIKAEDESAEGLIVLSGDDAIIGMEFLTLLDKFLVVGRNVVMLSESPDQAGPPMGNLK